MDARVPTSLLALLIICLQAYNILGYGCRLRVCVVCPRLHRSFSFILIILQMRSKIRLCYCMSFDRFFTGFYIRPGVAGVKGHGYWRSEVPTDDTFKTLFFSDVRFPWLHSLVYTIWQKPAAEKHFISEHLHFTFHGMGWASKAPCRRPCDARLVH